MKPLTLLRDAVRAQEIVGTLVKHGFAEILEDTETPVAWLSKLTGKISSGATTWQRIRMVCEDLGPTFVKVGQILSTRGDLLPEPLIEELKLLRNQVKPVPFTLMREVLDQEFRECPEDIFSSISPEPVACGSMAQVHRAVLRADGQPVAVKIQRPGIERSIRADMEILTWLAKQLNRRIDALQPWDLPAVVEELAETLRQELDFTRECRNLEIFQQHNPYVREVFSPRVYPAYCTRKVLVTEWVDGKAPDDPSIPLALRPRLASSGARSVFHQIVIDGFFHADPHGGNVLVTADGRLCFLDWGAAGQLTRNNRYYLADLFVAVVERNVEKVARIAQSMNRGLIWVDAQALEKAVASILTKYNNIRMQDQIGHIIFEMMYVFGSNGIPLTRDYALLAKAIVALTETGRTLDPHFDLAAAARPFLQQLQMERWNPASLLLRGFWQFTDTARRLNELPGDMQRVLRRIEREDLRIKLRHENLEEVADQAMAAINRLVLAIITASLIIGSSLVIRANVPPLLWGSYSLIGVAGYLGSVLLGIWIIIDILRHGRHR